MANSKTKQLELPNMPKSNTEGQNWVTREMKLPNGTVSVIKTKKGA